MKVSHILQVNGEGFRVHDVVSVFSLPLLTIIIIAILFNLTSIFRKSHNFHINRVRDLFEGYVRFWDFMHA